jgi:fructosamine-3-kinase
MSEWRHYAEALLHVHSLPARELVEREGYNHHTYISSNSVVRIPRADHSFAGEVWAMKQARSKDLPVPKIIAVEEKNVLIPYMLEERLKGEHITSKDITPSVSRQAGAALAKIHSVKTQNYGWINGNGNGRYKDWKPYLESRRKHIDEAVYRGLLDLSEVSVMHKMYNHLEGLPEQKPVLLHGDFQFNNLLFNKRKLSGIIDFSPRSGPIEFDIGGVAACLNGDHFKNFEEGYGKKIDESNSLLYAIDKLIGMMVFYSEHKPSIVPKLQKKIDDVINRLFRKAA